MAQLARLVNNDIGRLRQLVDDLLEISRLDAKAAETTLEWIDAPGFVRRLVDVHGWTQEVHVMEDGDAPYPEEGLPGGYVFRTDKRRLERILVNLIENALRHGDAPVTVDVLRYSVIGADDSKRAALSIAVTDSGPGISLNPLAHVFDRFYKAAPSRSSSRGSGLGLAIARENARLLRGDLTAANAPGGGARFLLTLPADE
jgi:two-component system sensor histidine kinase MtrB